MEPTPELYIEHLVGIFREVRRVLRDDGTLWLNIAGSYANQGGHTRSGVTARVGNTKRGLANLGTQTVPLGFKPKDWVPIPWMLGMALQRDGWWLRSPIIWAKGLSFCETYSGSVMPESVRDRPTTSYEYLLLLAKSKSYYYDQDAVRESLQETTKERIKHGWHGTELGGLRSEPEATERMGDRWGPPAGRNLRSVWAINPFPFSGWAQTVHLARVAQDAVSDGIIRIESPDCPVHGDPLGQVPMDACGEHAADALSCKSRTDSHPAQGLLVDSAPIAQHLEHCSETHNWDSPNRPYAPSATDHSKQNHRTARVLATNPSCKPCVETHDRTDDKSGSQGFAGQRESNPASNTWPDEMDAHSLDQTLCHTVDKSSLPIPPSCLCGFYHKVTKETSHFATFPPKLVEPCIKAGTSERGCCPECGKGWERIIEKTGHINKREPAYAPHSAPTKTDSTDWGPTTRATDRWRPGCSCNMAYPDTWVSPDDPAFVPYEPVPCTVLDPFSGSGTTVMVALRLGRRALGIELSEPYVKMSRRRIIDDCPMLNIPGEAT